MINPVDRLSWQEMLGHPASAGHLVDTQVNTAYNKMAALSDHIDEFKDLYDFVFRIKGWLRYYLQANYGLKDTSESGLNNDTNGIGEDIDLFNPAGGSGSGISAEGEIITKKVWRIYIKNYDEMVRASYEGMPIPNPIVRFANIYDPSKPSYLDLSYDDNGNPTFSGTFNAKDPNSFIPLRYLNEQIAILRRDLAKVVSVNRSISTTTDSQGRANKRLVVNDVINFSDGSHINALGAADVPFMATGGTVNITGDATGTGNVDANGNVVVPTTVSHATNADYATKATSADKATNANYASYASEAGIANSVHNLLGQKYYDIGSTILCVLVHDAAHDKLEYGAIVSGSAISQGYGPDTDGGQGGGDISAARIGTWVKCSGWSYDNSGQWISLLRRIA